MGFRVYVYFYFSINGGEFVGVGPIKKGVHIIWASLFSVVIIWAKQLRPNYFRPNSLYSPWQMAVQESQPNTILKIQRSHYIRFNDFFNHYILKSTTHFLKSTTHLPDQ